MARRQGPGLYAAMRLTLGGSCWHDDGSGRCRRNTRGKAVDGSSKTDDRSGDVDQRNSSSDESSKQLQLDSNDDTDSSRQQRRRR